MWLVIGETLKTYMRACCLRQGYYCATHLGIKLKVVPGAELEPTHPCLGEVPLLLPPQRVSGHEDVLIGKKEEEAVDHVI